MLQDIYTNHTIKSGLVQFTSKMFSQKAAKETVSKGIDQSDVSVSTTPSPTNLAQLLLLILPTAIVSIICLLGSFGQSAFPELIWIFCWQDVAACQCKA